MRRTVETTFGDLRSTDLIIDKAGQVWPLAELEVTGDTAAPAMTFWLLDSVTRIRMHNLTKPFGDPVKVSRLETQADEAAKLEAEMPTPSDDVATAEEAVAAVEEVGGEVEAVVTAEEHDAAAAATEIEPLRLPPFQDLTILEMRSHLYLLHGVYAHDMESRLDTIAMHEKAHADHDAGKLQSRYIPHTHGEA